MRLSPTQVNMRPDHSHPPAARNSRLVHSLGKSSARGIGQGRASHIISMQSTTVASSSRGGDSFFRILLCPLFFLVTVFGSVRIKIVFCMLWVCCVGQEKGLTPNRMILDETS
jgi:hypothetical protein